MSMADVQNARAIPAKARFDLKPTAVPAKRTRVNIQPYQYPTGAITSNQLIQFFIPARRGTMYDPQTAYLKGTIENVVASGVDESVTLNRNAFSLINRLQVIGQGSLPLEDIQNYNELVHMLTDIQMSREDKRGLSTLYGGAEDVDTIDDGFTFPNATGTATTTGSLSFCLPIISSFGVLADKYIPVGWLNSDLRFDFYTELPDIAFRDESGDAVSYRLTNLELVVDVIEFDGEGMSMVSQFAPLNGTPLYLHATGWKNYVSTISTGTIGFNSQLLPHRSLSVKEVLCAGKKATAGTFDSFARFLPYGSSNLQVGLSIGGMKYPQKPIQTIPELFAELQKSQHALNQIAMNGSIARTEYNRHSAGVSSVATSLTSKSVIGFDTEIYDKKGSTMINGQNWTGLNVMYEGYVSETSAGLALTAPVTVQHFVAFDVIYVIQDGVISVRY